MRQGQGVGGRGWGWGGGGGGVLDALAEGWVAAARAGTARFRVAWGAEWSYIPNVNIWFVTHISHL